MGAFSIFYLLQLIENYKITIVISCILFYNKTNDRKGGQRQTLFGTFMISGYPGTDFKGRENDSIMSFANWDEIIDTCMNYSTKNMDAFASASFAEKRTPRRFIRAAQALDSNAGDLWTNNEMLAHNYATAAKT